MSPPKVVFKNRTEILASWERDSFHKGGPIFQYQIMIYYANKSFIHEFDPGQNDVNVTKISLAKDESLDLVI